MNVGASATHAGGATHADGGKQGKSGGGKQGERSVGGTPRHGQTNVVLHVVVVSIISQVVKVNLVPRLVTVPSLPPFGTLNQPSPLAAPSIPGSTILSLGLSAIGVAIAAVAITLIGYIHMPWLDVETFPENRDQSPVPSDQSLHPLTKELEAAVGKPPVEEVTVPAEPTLDRELARNLMKRVNEDKSFRFYTDIDKPTGISANNLESFCRCLLQVEPISVSFHLERQDFQDWLSLTVGDRELSSKLSGLRGLGFSSEEVKGKVYSEVKSRCDELSAILHK